MNREKLNNAIRAQAVGTESGTRNLLPLYANRDAVNAMLTVMSVPYAGKIDYICSPESLGFIVGSMLSRELGVGFVGIRKDRKLPAGAREQAIASYIDHRNNVATLSVDKKLLPEGSRVLLVDDWVETAATIQACMHMMEDLGCTVVGVAAVGANYTEATKDLIDSGLVTAIVCEKKDI